MSKGKKTGFCLFSFKLIQNNSLIDFEWFIPWTVSFGSKGTSTQEPSIINCMKNPFHAEAAISRNVSKISEHKHNIYYNHTKSFIQRESCKHK